MKKLNTKLTLNKESVASLNDSEMMNVQGGVKQRGPQTVACPPPPPPPNLATYGSVGYFYHC
jgi:natural product precursor